MKIYTAEQVRRWDSYTIDNEPISSIDLMERAAYRASYWIMTRFSKDDKFIIYCGSGNNGGDGLVIARYLFHYCYNVKVVKLMLSEKGSEDFEQNLERLLRLAVPVRDYSEEREKEDSSAIVIDALFGSGLTRRPEGLAWKAIQEINLHNGIKISVDIPSGMYCTFNTSEDMKYCVWADYTVSFQTAKLAFLLPTSGPAAGALEIIDIGLDKSFENNQESKYERVDESFIQEKLKRRERFSHKGSYGHAWLVAGSEGKAGAAVLAGKACLLTGAGLVTVNTPEKCLHALQSGAPELMVHCNKGVRCLEGKEVPQALHVGVGPGIGTHPGTLDYFTALVEQLEGPAVQDADAINMLASNKLLLPKLFPYSILTPHPREFERLVGKWNSEEEKLDKLANLSEAYSLIVILKGAYSVTCLPSGKMYFNSTGNQAMATAGSGDVLTGMVLSFIAQGYLPEEAAVMACYLHGTAGDIAADKNFRITAMDICEAIPEALKAIQPEIWPDV